MNQAVLRNGVAVVNAIPAADRNNQSPTSTRIKNSASIGTKTKEVATIAEVTPRTEANRTIPRIGSFSAILAPLGKRMPALLS